ncbi:response regulator [Glaciecola siphonariae]
MRDMKPRFLSELKRVLIVDDDDDDVFIIEERLAPLVCSECEIVSCCDKQLVIEYLQSNSFDLCLLDHHLGYFEGVEILRALDDKLIATPIIMLTGQNDEQVENLAIKLGAQDYIMKSAIDSEVFAKSIRYAVSRKELEFAKVSNQRIQSENIAKDKFIAHLSHELRTPLTSILGYTSLLLENDSAAPLQKELSIIANNGKHLLNLLNDVLDLSKIAAGKFELQNRETDLHKLIKEVYSLLSVNALDKGLAFECATQTPIYHTVMIDELRLKQVLINLLGNAIKFTDSGRVSMSLAQVDDTDLVIKVIDTGIGMDETQIDSIFTPFTQIEDVANRKAGGAGLGLSISSEIIKQMHGSIHISSVFGQGSEFTVTLPIVKADDERRSHLEFELQKEPEAAKDLTPLAGRVLIVDDVFEIRQLLGQYVKHTGCEVEYARNGKSAIDIYQQAKASGTPIDLVLMDLHMPLMTGQEAMLALKEMAPQLPVVAVTAAIQKGTKQSLFELGFQGLLAKPIDRDLLLKTLKQFLTEDVQTGIKGRIALVEDDADSAGIMQILLGKLNYSVTHFSNAQDCFAGLSQEAFNLVLLDLGLPDLSGDILLSELRERFPDIDVIVLSGEQVSDSNMSRYRITSSLLKPVSLQQLQTLL